MEKTYSQKVAGVFEAVSYLLLTPAGIGLLYAFGLFIWGAKSGKSILLLLGAIPFVVTGVGVTLLVGYFKHARGRLDKKRVAALWRATAVFNFLLALPWLYGFSSFVLLLFSQPPDTDGWRALFISGSILFAYGAIIYFALKAAASEKTKSLY